MIRSNCIIITMLRLTKRKQIERTESDGLMVLLQLSTIGEKFPRPNIGGLIMKKRVLSFVLIVALVCAMTVNVSAATVTQRKPTSGGSSGILNVTATLNANSSVASASTQVDVSENVTIGTTLNYTFWNSFGHEEARGTSGHGYVQIICPIAGMGRSANSTHEAKGGTYWGNWTGHLSTQAYG